MDTKRCSKCGEVKDTSEFYIRNGKPIAACKECTKQYSKKHRSKQRQRMAIDPEFREKILEQFRRNASNYRRNHPDRIATYNKTHPEVRGRASKKYREAHREERRLACERWNKAHREEQRTAAKKWREENPEHYKKSVNKWRKANKKYIQEYRKQYRIEHRDEIRAYQKQWLAENLDKCRAINNARRSRETNAPGYATKEQRAARWDVFGGKCYICGKEAEELDHVKPLAKGGANWPCNLRPICKSCNSRKRTIWPFSEVIRRMVNDVT